MTEAIFVGAILLYIGILALVRSRKKILGKPARQGLQMVQSKLYREEQELLVLTVTISLTPETTGVLLGISPPFDRPTVLAELIETKATHNERTA